MDALFEQLESKDTKQRLNGITLLQDAINNGDVTTSNILHVIDLLLPCMSDVNYKISEGALICVNSIVDQLNEDLKPHLPRVVPAVLERLGDNKNVVREKALDTLLSIFCFMDSNEAANVLSDGFAHKNYKIREFSCVALCRTINDIHPEYINVKLAVNFSLKMLADPNASVRESAMIVLQELYRFYGEGIVNLLNRSNIRSVQLKEIMDRFENIQIEESIIAIPEIEEVPKSAKKKVSAVDYDKLIPKPISTPSIQSAMDVSMNSSEIDTIVIAERDLLLEFEQISNILKTSKEDWNSRVKAMKSIQSIVAGGAYAYPTFFTSFSSAKEALGKQLLDLRSAIVKEACNTINVMVTIMGDHFEPLAEFFIPILFKTFAVTIQVIAEAGNNCLRTIIQNCKLSKALPKLLEGSAARHNGIRARCVECILLLLEVAKPQNLEKFADVLEDSIKASLMDALPEVRSTSRKSFWLYHQNFSDRANRLMSTLDATTQKHLRTEEEKLRNSGDSIKSTRSDRPEQSTPLQSKRISTAPTPISSNKQVKVKRGVSAIQRDLQVITDPNSINMDKDMIEYGKKLNPSGKENIHIPTVNVNVVTVQKNNYEFSNDLKTAAKKALEVYEQKPEVTKTKTSTYVPSPEDLNNNFDFGNVEMEEAQTEFVKPATKPKKPITAVPSVRKVSSHQEESQETDIVNMLHDCSNPDWEIRVKCIQILTATFRTEMKASEIVMHFRKVMDKYLSLTSDTHYKVVNECLLSMQVMVTAFPSQFEPYLERVFSKIFLKLNDSKDVVKTTASAVLETIGETFVGDILLPILFKVLDNSNSKIQLACLEYIMHIIPNSLNYLSNSSHLRQCIIKIVSIASQRTLLSTCKKACIAVLLSLYKINASLFLEQVVLLPMNEHILAKKLLEPHVPMIEIELSHISKQKRHKYSPERNISTADVEDTEMEESSLPTYSSRHIAEKQTFITDIAMTEGVSLRSSTDTDAYSTILSLLERQLENVQDKRTFLKKMKAVSKENDEEFWLQYFAKVLFKILDFFTDEDSTIRYESMVLLKDIQQLQSVYFSDFAELTLRRVLERCADTANDVRAASEEFVEKFIGSLDPMHAFQVLSPLLASENEVILLGSIRLLSRIVNNIAAEVLLEHIPTVLPNIFQAFTHPNVDIRKTVVYCLVDIYIILGDRFKPYLSRLNTSQLKLVTIYLQRKNLNLKTTQQEVWSQ